MEDTLNRMERHSHGSRATYMGDNRVLVRIVVAGADIAYFVEANDKLLTPWFTAVGGYETELTNFFVRNLRPDSHCLDIGSNFGYFSCLMARFCPQGRVIGVEPDHAIFELACDNVNLNGLQDIAEIRQAAAGNTDADVTLFRRNSRSGNTSIARLSDEFTRQMRESPVTPFSVRGVRVDQLVEQLGGRVDFIKVDVEGAEPLVFEGAQAAIAGNPQVAIIMEWSPGQIHAAGLDPTAFLRQLREMGLEVWDLVDGREAPLTFDALLGLPYRAGVVFRRTKAK